MTKSKALPIILLILTIIYTFLMFINLNGFNFKNYWFSLVLIFIGIYSLIYYGLYRLDSALYYGVLHILLAFASYFKMTNLTIFKNLPLYFISFMLAHLSIFVTFRQNIHFKLFAILLLQTILIVSYKINLLSLVSFVTINALFIALIGINIAYRLTKNLRRR